jgi:DNA-binding response OmpR family regulator
MDSQKKILIIDDDPEYVEGIEAILTGAGYQVDARFNPNDGFAALNDHPYDLLLLDIMMGRGAEGVMLARKISKEAKFQELPILIITGIREQIAFLFPGQPVHPRFMPVDELLEKPVAPDLLLEKVQGLLKLADDKKLHKV